MLRMLAFIVGLFAPAFLAVPAWAQAAQPPALPFAGDGRLQKSITIERRFLVLDEALREIGEATGVSLRATGRIASENVVVLAANRPAVEILEILTDTLGYRWQKIRSDSGKLRYEMFQDEKGGSEEHRLRLERRKDALRRIQENCRLRIEPDGHKRSARLEALKRRQEGRDLSPSEQRALFTERDMLKPAEGSDLTLLSLLLQLWPRIEERLLRGSTIRLSSTGAPGMDRLPGNLAQRVLTALGKEPLWSAHLAAAPRPIEVRLKTYVDWMDATASLHVSWDLGIPSALELGDAANDYQRSTSTSVALRSMDEKTAPVVSDDPRLQQTVQAKPAAKYPPRLVPDDPTTYFPTPFPVDLFSLLHEARPEISFVGDAYLTPLRSIRGSGKPLDLLNETVLTTGSGWRWDSRGYVMLRSRNVPDDRPASVPASFFRALYQRAEQHGGVTLADYAWVAASLSDEQIMRLSYQSQPALLAYVPGTVLVFGPLQYERQDLRLFASLTQPQMAMLTERGLPASELSRGQLELLEAALDESERAGQEVPALSAELLSALTFRLVRRPEASPRTEGYILEWRLPGKSAPVKQANVTLNRWPDFATVAE